MGGWTVFRRIFRRGNHRQWASRPSDLKELGLLELGRNKAEKSYFKWAEWFYRRASAIKRRRQSALDRVWVLTLALGAGITLSHSVGAPAVLAAVLGFLVVLTQGWQRFCAERAEFTADLDSLLRGIYKEARELCAGQPPYNNARKRLDEFVKRVERLMLTYDKAAHLATRRLLGSMGGQH
jgi:hypothetical protein